MRDSTYKDQQPAWLPILICAAISMAVVGLLGQLEPESTTVVSATSTTAYDQSMNEAYDYMESPNASLRKQEVEGQLRYKDLSVGQKVCLHTSESDLTPTFDGVVDSFDTRDVEPIVRFTLSTGVGQRELENFVTTLGLEPVTDPYDSNNHYTSTTITYGWSRWWWSAGRCP